MIYKGLSLKQGKQKFLKVRIRHLWGSWHDKMNILVHDIIKLLWYQHWIDKQK